MQPTQQYAYPVNLQAFWQEGKDEFYASNKVTAQAEALAVEKPAKKVHLWGLRPHKCTFFAESLALAEQLRNKQGRNRGFKRCSSKPGFRLRPPVSRGSSIDKFIQRVLQVAQRLVVIALFGGLDHTALQVVLQNQPAGAAER